MRRMFGLVSGVVAGMFAISSAYAQGANQSHCASRAEVVKVLAAKYQESQRVLGLINEKTIMEVYASPKGTWTLVITNQNGISCVLADGEAWDEKPMMALGPSS